MSTLGFGVPTGAIFQYAYSVEDIHRAMNDYVERLGIGPWSLRDRFSPPTARLRGQPHSPTFSLARSFSGNTMIELIQQHDDGPSVFHEGSGPRRYGFHHWGIVSAAFEDDLAGHVEQGYPEAFYDELPSGSRVAYVDTTRDFPGMLELVEYSAAQDRFYTSIYEATLGWDGASPVPERELMGRVEGKVVVITGAASGQGEAEAKLLAHEGATVVATDIHETTDVFDGTSGVKYRRVDVASAADWGALGEWLGSEHDRVDGLVNNAGIPFRARLEEVSIADWDRVIAINLTGPLLGIQTVAPLMTNGGSIVNVSSVAGLTAHFGVAYTTSKWGLRGLSKVASLELGPRGIRVNTIFPGYIETPMTASASPAFRETNIRETPLGRTGSVDEVAPLVLYPVSDESSYVSGVEIPIDGGLSSHGATKSMSDAVRALAAGT